MNPDDVTLAVPCYNVEDTLSPALDAIMRLDPSPASVLCVDDGSTDDTKEIIKEYDDVRLIEHEQNQGLGTTLNTALAHAETPLFAKVDGDIVVPSNWLEVIGHEKEESEAAFVQGRFIEQVTTSADKWRSEYPCPPFSFDPERNKPINGSNTLADTEALRDIGGWDEQFLRAFDDIDVMERLIEKGYDIYYSPSVRATHIRTDTWREVLRTDWAYFNNPSTYGKPESLSDVLNRVPAHFYRSAERVLLETFRRRPTLVGISMLQLPFHLMWDLTHVMGGHLSKESVQSLHAAVSIFVDVVEGWCKNACS